MHQLRTLRVLALGTAVLAGAISPAAGAQGIPRDTIIDRGDRSIYHEYPAGEREWGYAQAIVVGNTIYVSGAVAAGPTMEAQVAAIYARLSRTLTRHGFTLRDVVKETVYTRDMPALAAANAVRKRAYGDHTPAATWVEITRLLSEGAMVEIEVTAVRGSPPGSR